MIYHSAGTEATAQISCGRISDSIANMQADAQEATTGIPTPNHAMERTTDRRALHF